MATTNSPAVECTGLSRVYSSRTMMGRRRDFVALKEINLEIPKGAVFGLLGPNGAGKTTTVRILSTLLTPTSGTARVLGYDVENQAKQVRRNTGFILGGERGLYGRITGEQNMRFFAALNHIRPRDAKRRIDQLLDRVGLAEHARTPVENYSRGMKQRLHIARGLLTDPARPVHGRAHHRHRSYRRPGTAKLRPRARQRGQDHPANDALYGRGRHAVRHHRNYRPGRVGGRRPPPARSSAGSASWESSK